MSRESNHANVGDALVDLRGLQRLGVPFSRQRLLELEKAGKFPRRLQLGPRRIGWLRAEIDEWLRGLAAARPGGGA